MRLVWTAKIQHIIVIKCLIKTFYEVEFVSVVYHMTDKETILTVEAEDELCDGKGVEDDE